MSHFLKKTTINDSAENVWKTIRDLGEVRKFLPMITSCSMEGSGVGAKRICTMEGGGTVHERVDVLDDQERLLCYVITESPLPVKNYVGKMRVRELSNNKCEFEWSSTFEAAGAPEGEIKKLIEDVFEAGFEGLRKLHSN